MRYTLKRAYKRLIAPAAAILWLAMAGVAGAQTQGNCFVNGKEVPCAEALQQFKSAVGLGIGAMVAIIALGLAAFVVWLMMLIHAATKPIENKAMWIIILIFTGIFGAIVYYFMVKRKFGKTLPPPPPQSTPQPRPMTS